MKYLIALFIFLQSCAVVASEEISNNNIDIQEKTRKTVKLNFMNTSINGLSSNNEGMTLRIYDSSKSDDPILTLTSDNPSGNIELSNKSSLYASFTPSKDIKWNCGQAFSLGGLSDAYDVSIEVEDSKVTSKRVCNFCFKPSQIKSIGEVEEISQNNISPQKEEKNPAFVYPREISFTLRPATVNGTPVTENDNFVMRIYNYKFSDSPLTSLTLEKPEEIIKIILPPLFRNLNASL